MRIDHRFLAVLSKWEDECDAAWEEPPCREISVLAGLRWCGGPMCFMCLCEFAGISRRVKKTGSTRSAGWALERIMCWWMWFRGAWKSRPRSCRSINIDMHCSRVLGVDYWMAIPQINVNTIARFKLNKNQSLFETFGWNRFVWQFRLNTMENIAYEERFHMKIKKLNKTYN